MKIVTRHPFFTIAILCFIFFVPMIFSWFMYQHANQWHLSQNNHGELIEPPIILETLHLKIKKQSTWLLLYIAPEHCLFICKQNLYELQQTHLALGKDQERIQRTVASLEFSPSLQEALQSYPEVTTTLISLKDLALLPTSSNHTNQLYVIDPHGNMMMHYPGSFKMRELHDDLKRLLKISQIG